MTLPGARPGPRRLTTWRPPAVVVLLGLAVVAAGCGTSGSVASSTATTTTVTNPADPWVIGQGGTITVGIDEAPSGCNPDSSTGNTWADQLVLEPVLPSTFIVGPNGDLAYNSAVISQAEVVSTNPQTVVYTINPEAVWSDGVAISATDFIYAWQEQRGTSTVAGFAGAFDVSASDAASTLGYDQIKSVTGSNHGRTVKVVFRSHFADWKMLFDDLLPAQVMKNAGWNPGCSDVEPQVDLSGGPYEIGKVVPGREVVLVRNPYWWGQVPYLDRIVIRIGKSPAQLAKWVTRGKVQVALPTSFDQSFLQDVSGRPSIESTESISSTFLQLEFSTTSPATSKRRVREALAYAVDRQALVNTVVGWADSGIVPAASHLYSQSLPAYPGPPTPSPEVSGQPGYTPSSTSTAPTASHPFPLTSDLADTDRLLETAGYFRGIDGTWDQPDGQRFVVRVAIDAGDQWAAAAGALLVHQLESAGITVTTLTAPNATAAGMDMVNDHVDAAVLPFESTPYPAEAIAWYTALLGTPGQGGSQDWSGFDNASLNAILTKASRQLNPVTAAPLYAEADALLWDQMVALPLFAEPTVLAWSAFTSGVQPNPNGPGLLWFPQSWALRVPATSPDTVPG